MRVAGGKREARSHRSERGLVSPPRQGRRTDSPARDEVPDFLNLCNYPSKC
jgi:hypothetical protein